MLKDARARVRAPSRAALEHAPRAGLVRGGQRATVGERHPHRARRAPRKTVDGFAASVDNFIFISEK